MWLLRWCCRCVSVPVLLLHRECAAAVSALMRCGAGTGIVIGSLLETCSTTHPGLDHCQLRILLCSLSAAAYCLGVRGVHFLCVCLVSNLDFQS